MRFELKRLPDYSDEAVLTELRRVAAVVPEAKLSIVAFRQLSRVSINTVRRRFGSWSKALGAAGLADRVNTVVPASKSAVVARSMTKDELAAELRRVAAMAGGHTLTVTAFRQHSSIGPDAVRGRLGSWSAALRYAGLAPVPHGRRYTDAECFENLLAVWTHLGQAPQYRQMSDPPSIIGGKAYMKRWGTWNRALHAFVLFAEQDSTPVAARPLDAPASPAPKSQPRSLADQRDVPLGLRYRILRRDHFRCVICGDSPATTLACELQVDHILAVCKGGKTVAENLRTLCKPCNLGKGGLVEGDA